MLGLGAQAGRRREGCAGQAACAWAASARQGLGDERGVRGLGARAGYELCTRCTRPFFDPV